MPFDDSKTIHIHFNSTNIQSLEAWYPPICHNPANYQNIYLFEGGKSLIINNLIINDYVITNKLNYPFIKSSNHFNASITCNNCRFTNVTSAISAPLIVTAANFRFSDCLFADVTMSNLLLNGTHQWNIDYSDRIFEIVSTEFVNITSDKASIFYLSESSNDVKFHPAPFKHLTKFLLNTYSSFKKDQCPLSIVASSLFLLIDT